MFCIVKARTHNEHVEPRVEFAVFEVSEDLISRIEGYSKQIPKIAPEPAYLEFWDYTPDFIDWPEMNDADLYENIEGFVAEEVGDEYGFVNPLSKPVEEWLQKSRIEVEVVRMCFSGRLPDDFYWEGYIKHSNIAFSTSHIKVADLKEAVSGKD